MRPVLEAVAGAAAGDPDAVMARQLVEQKVAVGRVLVLADAGVEQRRMASAGRWSASASRIRSTEAGVDHARHALRVGESPCASIADLDAAMLEVGSP